MQKKQQLLRESPNQNQNQNPEAFIEIRKRERENLLRRKKVEVVVEGGSHGNGIAEEESGSLDHC